MKSGDREIGFAYIKDNLKEAPKNVSSSLNNNKGFAGELQHLLEKYGYSTGSKELDVATGKLTLEQINLIFKNMPVDLSYVDENEIVKFYTDTKHRIFPRSKNVIGRDVKNCHSRKSVHIVEEIVEKFRSGEEDLAEFWINKPELFIHITYIAIRDYEGKFRGILEMMQDCTHIRSLTGSQTLLTW
ncbi:PAS domain-containing protein [Clostridium sp. DSM 8431]|uniref:PAS domain-containing protein n=1 Tax=Clostridium sp. DSM 8431 TaxID=1761781 RepID=UPI0008F18171|nr:PAS domain-containing protein [Clostridium sp. DSM 8431]SFU75253.1 PAS domain-containing protein [Clostridium sp. DSM 8431]